MSNALSENSFTFLFSDLSRLFRRCWEDQLDTAGLDLTTSDIKALTFVGRAEGIKQTNLAASLGVEPMTASAVLDRLERKGLVLRLPDPLDRRAKLIKQTEAGKKLAEAVEPLADDIIKTLTDGVNRDELGVAVSALCRMRKNLAAAL